MGLTAIISKRKELMQVYKEQIALQNMTAVGWTKNGRGQISADLIIPQNLPRELDSMSNKLAFWNRAVNLASTSVVNWGKNTQWAGRQLTVGFSVPLTMMAVAAGKAANDVDQQLTRIAKVYDTAFTGNLTAQKAAQAREAELSSLKASSMNLATSAARAYGVQAKDTLQVEAELAATGLKGNDLRRSTAEVLRIATLGELDYQKAVELSISLQNAYGLTTEQVGEKFNFLNSIENATSLSLQDMTDAIPRAGAALGGLGVTVEQTGILLVAMKEHGVNAAEGANALKSATTRLLKPTAAAKESFAGLGINIQDVADRAKGNLFTILNELAVRLKGIDPYRQQQAIAALFGTYQFNRLNAALSGITDAMGGVGDATSQTARSIEVANQSTKDWATTAKGELNEITQSSSGKLKIAFASMNAELAKVGAPLLENAASVLEFVTRLLQKFDEMPGAAKNFMLISGVALAIAGPLIMLAGLFANIIGNVLKFTSTIVGMAKAFKITNAEERAAILLQEQASRGWNDQASSAMILSTAIRAVNDQLAQNNKLMVAGQVASMSLAAGPAIIQKTNKAGNPYYMYDKSAAGQEGVPKNMRADRASYERYMAQKQVIDDFEKAATATSAQTAQIATNSERAAGHWGKIAGAAGGVAIAGVAIASMVAPSNETAQNFLNIAMVAAMIGPMFAGSLTVILDRFKAAGTALKAGLFNVRAANGFKASMGASLGTLKNFVGAFGRFAGPAGLLITAGLLIVKMRNDLKATEEAQRQINNSAKEWSEILGYTYQQAEINQGKTKASVEETKKLADANKALADRIGKAGTEQELLNIAIGEGIKVRTSGGSADDALKAVDTVLRVAGKSGADAEALVLKIKASIDFTDIDKMAKDAVENFRRKFEDIASNNYDQSNSESFLRAIGIGEALNVGAKTAAEGLAKDFVQTLETQTGENRGAFFANFVKQMEGTDDQVFEKLLSNSKNKEIFSSAGINNAQTFIDYYYKALENNQRVMSGGQGQTMELPSVDPKDLESMQRYANAQAEIVKAIARESGVSDELIPKMRTMNDLREALRVPTRTAADVQAQYNETLREAARAGIQMSEAEKLAHLNALRASAGMEAVSNSAGDVANAARAAAQETDVLGAALKSAGLEADSAQSAFKSASSDTMDALYSRVNSDFDDMLSARLDRAKARGDAAIADIERREQASSDRFEKKKDALDRKYTQKQREFDDNWDRIMQAHDVKWEKRLALETKVFDQRLQAAQAQIDAERANDDARQQMFEAEKSRLERLANLSNRNIDFNSALGAGKMDEAAKISNDIQAQQQGYVLEDSANGAKAASEKRISDLEKRMDVIRQEKEARLDAIKAAEDAEKALLDRKKELAGRALDDQKDAAKRALEAQQEAAKRSFDAEKKAQQRRSELNEKRVQRQNDAERASFQLQLKVLQAYIPTNNAERAKHMKDIEALYNRYGGKFTANARGWSDLVGQSLRYNMQAAGNSLKSDINWKQIGATAAADAISGAFGMSVAEFSKWVTTGAMPADGLGGSAKPVRKADPNKRVRPGGGPNVAFHSGGIVGQSMGRRTGVPSFAPQRPSEVTANLLKGEAVLNRNATAGLGHDAINALNSGKAMDAIGGPDLGMSGMVGAGIAGMVKSVISQAVTTAGNRRQAQSGIGDMLSGQISGVKMSSEQLANASKIISAGKSFGATSRDLIIALMTAMQESTMRNLNYGDRDSIGLFQQRNAWGSHAARLDPYQATKMFFYGGAAGQRGLFDFKNRDKMSLTQAAQSVQVSAFPNAYAKWESLARELLGGYSSSGMSSRTSGFGRPISGGRISSEYGMRVHPITGVRKLHNGIDIAAPVGTPIYASAGGSVARAGMNGGYGNWTVLNHMNGIQTAYAHQKRINVRPGQQVSRGQVIGDIGMTGSTTGPHLHFMAGRNGNWVNPRSIIPGLSQGGFTLNTGLAELHPRETVLTAPLSRDLKEGITNLDSSSQNVYNIHVDARGSKMTPEEYKNMTKKALMEIERDKGVQRRVGVSK